MEKKYIGYVKYSGESVEDGIMDARKSARALLGFDEVVRYFASKEDPFLLNLNYELPVKIQKGSWEILLPIVEKLLTPEGALSVYIVSSTHQAAKEGLFETGISKDLKKIFKGSIVAMQLITNIAKHVGSFRKNLKVKHDLENAKVEITNDNGESLVITKEQYKLYQDCPDSILSKLAENIEDNRVLKIGIFTEDGKKEVEITEQDKNIFCTGMMNENEILYPDWNDGDSVTLEGTITKVNEKANTLGFQYENHILTILPISHSVTDYKSQLISNDHSHIFREVRIEGIIDRKGKNGEVLKKPKVIFSSLITINRESDTGKLL